MRLSVFKLNQEKYPKSANVYDSYGDALLTKEDTLKVLINFKKVEAIDSAFFDIKKKIKVMEENSMSNTLIKNSSLIAQMKDK